MAFRKTSVVAGLVLAAGLVAPADGAFVASGTLGGGQLPPTSAAIGGSGTLLVTARPSSDRRTVEIGATISGGCGGLTFERRANLSSAGDWSIDSLIVQRTKLRSVAARVKLRGSVSGDEGSGTAFARLLVRTGKSRVRRCVARTTSFQLHRSSTASGAPDAALGGALYTGLTYQSIPSRSYPVVLRTSPEGRTLIGLGYKYFCLSRGDLVTESVDFINRGRIAAGGRFHWSHSYSLRLTRNLLIRAHAVVDGQFLTGGRVTGTIAFSSTVNQSGRVTNYCKPPEKIRFTASAG